MTNDIAFKTINALSCHNIPTINQPIKPKLAMYKFKGNIFKEVNNMERSRCNASRVRNLR